MTAADIEIAHGYTLGDLEKMTRAAVIADRSLAADVHTRRDIAWSAIAEYLSTSQERPDRQELIRVGWQAIYRDARDAYRLRGRPDEAWSTPEMFKPRFTLYWRDFMVVPSHEHAVVERLALKPILDLLAPPYRDAVIALALHDTYQRAAAALGISDAAFRERIRVARRRALAAWFEHETPRRTYRTDRRVGTSAGLSTRCSAGHEWTPENTYIRRRMLRGKPHTSRVCKACERQRSAARTAARKAAA